tara:strand:- start:35 stop:457 length:423 start_codon:yes stop_codon:yes gene_type:complete
MKRIIACLLLIAPLTANADNWLCIGEQSTGFFLEGGAWEITGFNPGKYLIKPSDDVTKLMDNAAVYQVHSFGNETQSWICPDFIEGKLVCYGFAARGDTFKYNRETGNFLTTTTMGYVETLKGKVSEDTPLIEIGKCSKL